MQNAETYGELRQKGAKAETDTATWRQRKIDLGVVEMEAAERWGRDGSKLTWRVKCKELSPWGLGLGVLGESGARGFLPPSVALYLREALGLRLE